MPSPWSTPHLKVTACILANSKLRRAAIRPARSRARRGAVLPASLLARPTALTESARAGPPRRESDAAVARAGCRPAGRHSTLVALRSRVRQPGQSRGPAAAKPATLVRLTLRHSSTAAVDTATMGHPHGIGSVLKCRTECRSPAVALSHERPLARPRGGDWPSNSLLNTFAQPTCTFGGPVCP
jgi:hypothetical protein